ncbi:MAG: aldehyde dehydrogenase family protein [Myxococcales bacterium]|nr:aldehyde dehydrogenase family protein [Myxococcales bacterium]
MTATTLDVTLDPRALARHLSGHHLIAGRLQAAHAGATFPIHNPASLEEVGNAAAGDATDVDRAVQAAHEAFAAWSQRPARERGKLVQACAAVLGSHAEELARLVALETGKAIRTESRIEAGVLADVFTYYGGLASELKGETIPFRPDVLAYTVREPLGVVGAILPWNAPLLLMALKIAPALVAGNTVVVKSAEEAPFAVLRVAELLQTVLPPGAFNLVSGDGPQCGAPLVAHPLVRKVTFTGSVATGRIVARGCADKLIPCTLELGGKSPMIVMPDADLERAALGAVAGMRFTRQGQSCTAASRMLVHRSVLEAFVAKVCARVDAMTMGDPLDEATDIGTIISRQQFDTVERYVRLGEATPGAVAHRCSRLPTAAPFDRGLFLQPVVFTGLGPDSPVVREEIFGPVTAVLPFDTLDEAIALANDSEYGLAATMWTRDLQAATQAVTRLQAGFVQVNQNLVVQPTLSYGGVKLSGLGKEASLEAMLEHFTHKKTVLISLV